MMPLKTTVLYIDTDAAELARRRLQLKAKHYEVLTAANGEHARELFFAHFVDAVIIGEHAEGIGADNICERMKKAKPHVPIMLLANYGSMPENALRYIDAFVFQGRPEAAFLASLDRMLNLSSRFFSRWLDNWKCRAASLQPEPKSKKIA